MSNNIDEKKIAEAKEKLACHIAPPGVAHSDAGASSASAAPENFIGDKGEVFLTRMTAAGG